VRALPVLVACEACSAGTAGQRLAQRCRRRWSRARRRGARELAARDAGPAMLGVAYLCRLSLPAGTVDFLGLPFRRYLVSRDARA